MKRLTTMLSPTMKNLYGQTLPIDAVGATCGSEGNCPHARGLRRQVKNAVYVKVCQNYILIGDENYGYRFSVSKKILVTSVMNDDDELVIDKPINFMGEMIGKPRLRNKLSEEAKENLRNRIKLGRASGLYTNNARRKIAKSAGKLGKKLRTREERELDTNKRTMAPMIHSVNEIILPPKPDRKQR